jgi:hypothetical protein
VELFKAGARNTGEKELGETMHTQACGEVEIEDLRGHTAETVAELRETLSDCATMIPDPKRAGFYEVQSVAATYYVHVSPLSGKILLLATWPPENATAPRS